MKHAESSCVIQITKRCLFGFRRVVSTLTVSSACEKSIWLDDRRPFLSNKSTVILKSGEKIVLVCTVIRNQILFTFYDMDYLSSVVLIQILLLEKLFHLFSVCYSNKIPSVMNSIHNILLISRNGIPFNLSLPCVLS